MEKFLNTFWKMSLAVIVPVCGLVPPTAKVAEAVAWLVGQIGKIFS